MFRYPGFREMVVAFPSYNAYAACDYSSSSFVCYGMAGIAGGCRVPLQAGTSYFASGMYSHCLQGQKVRGGMRRGRDKQREGGREGGTGGTGGDKESASVSALIGEENSCQQ